jgi:DNA-damage-inducible protein D
MTDQIRIPETSGPSGTFAALERHPVESPFDAIRRVTLEGREFWSARDLMPLLGYEKWERFADAIARAKVAAHNSGHDVAQNFPAAGKVSGSRGPAQADYHLSRYACYLISLNGDPRKLEIARAQTYFVIKTREAETARAITGPELFARAVLEAQAMLEQKDARIAELEPKADFYDELMDADGTYSMLATAKILGWGRNVMMRELRRLGVLQGNRLPYQRYEHHFKVTPSTYKHPKTGELIPTATTTVRPSGLEFLRKKLASALELAEVDQ